MVPFVEVFAPVRLSNGDWCARAAINLGGGAVQLAATAPDRVAAQAVAKLQALAASKLGRLALAHAAPKLLLPSGVAGIDEVGGFFGDIGKAIGRVCRSKIFKKLVSGVCKIIPYVGDTLGKVAPDALDAAGKALGAAKKGDKKAKKAIRQNLKKARAGDPRARAANGLLLAKAKFGQTKGGNRALVGTLQAGRLVAAAAEGDEEARGRIVSIAEQAGQGHRASVEAMAFIAAAQRSLVPDAPQIADGGDPYEPDEYELEAEAVEGLKRATVRRIANPKAAALSAPKRALVVRLRYLAQQRPGYRRRAA